MRLLSIAATILLFAVLVKPAHGSGSDDYLLLIEKDEEAREPGLTYRRIYEQKLFVTPGDVARYFFSPAFRQPEMAASVYRDPAKAGGLRGGYWITATKASHRIFGAAYGTAAYDPRTIGVTRRDAPLPEPIARRVNHVWLEMLSQARPRTRLQLEVDSDIIIFSASTPTGRNLRACPYGSERKSERMISLGDQLVEYAAAPVAERPARAKAIEQDLSKLEKALDATR